MAVHTCCNLKVVLILSGLALAAGRRVVDSSAREQLKRATEQVDSSKNPWKAIAVMLLTADPAAAFNVGSSRVPGNWVAPRAPGSFVAPRQPSALAPGDNVYNFGRRPSALRMMANPDSKPTGLVWPSEKAEEKVRTVDGITLYPTHAWTDDMVPVLPAENTKSPVMIGVAADSGCGKSTFLRRVMGALGTEVTPGHTAVGDMMTVVCLDDYHINDRAGRKATGLTALDAKENDFSLMGAQMTALKDSKAVYKPIYNHDTGFKDPPELVQPNDVMIFEGLHPLYDAQARDSLDLGIYVDIVNDVKFAWKVQRDVAERGWTEEQVKEDIQKRLPDFSEYVDPQKANADVVLRYEPSDKGLPFLKVKLIQKKEGAFPMVTLKNDVKLSSGATVRTYDSDWFGSPATVIEMDGVVSEEDMEAQIGLIEANLEGLSTQGSKELTNAMLKLKTSPGSDNGTGLLQTVIAIQVRALYEALSSK